MFDKTYTQDEMRYTTRQWVCLYYRNIEEEYTDCRRAISEETQRRRGSPYPTTWARKLPGYAVDSSFPVWTTSPPHLLRRKPLPLHFISAVRQPIFAFPFFLAPPPPAATCCSPATSTPTPARNAIRNAAPPYKTTKLNQS